MKVHPAITMLLTWLTAIAVFVVLPFQLESRRVTIYGFVVLAALIAAFCISSLAASRPLPKRDRPFTVALDLTLLDYLIVASAGIAVLFQTYNILTGNVLDLGSAYEDRNLRSTVALSGSEAGGSLAFQIAFLFYPVGYIAIARELILREKLNWTRLASTGVMPIVLASIAMGGRGPILYALLLIAISWSARRSVFSKLSTPRLVKQTGRNIPIYVAFAVVSLVAMNYFVQVFVARADFVGGVESMLDFAALRWGVSFDGPGSDVLQALIGKGNTYLLYVFVWYGVQGIVISNSVFTDYVAGPTFGVYGLDLGSAVARRVAPEFVADRFSALLDINVYGFLPSAFGTLYIDFKHWAIIPVFVWGYASGFFYRNAHTSGDVRWFFAGPFVTLGIVFSLINTPLGLSNGLMTHVWLVLALFLARPVRFNLGRPIAT